MRNRNRKKNELFKNNEVLETKPKLITEKLSKKKIWLPVAIAFTLLCIFSLLNEILDFPHLILGAPPTPVNWHETIIEIIMITTIGIIVLSVLFYNISAREQAEAELSASKERYHEAYNRAEFYKDLLSHDIANILQNIMFTIDISLSYSNNAEKLKENFSNLQEPVKRARRLISNVKKLSRLDNTKIELNSIEVNTVLKEAINFVNKSFHGRKINIRVDSPYKEIFAQANSLLSEVFENILYNAIKYCQNLSIEIDIRISKVQKDTIDYVKLEFIDNGIGIPDIRKELIFQRAYTEDRSVSGMGIGLSLVKAIITRYKGQIRVEDKVQGDYSKGSNFIILIPEVI